MTYKKKIFKFSDLFSIDEKNTHSLVRKNKYFPISNLIKLKNPILNKFGVYFIFDKRIIQKKNNQFLKSLIYIGSAGGSVKKKVLSKPNTGETFFKRIHKHWLVTIGADKYLKPKPFSSISGSKKWRDYRNQINRDIIYKKKFDLEKNHLNLVVGIIEMKNLSNADKKKIHYFEQFVIHKFKEKYGHIPICNTEYKFDNNLSKIYRKYNFNDRDI